MNYKKKMFFFIATMMKCLPLMESDCMIGNVALIFLTSRVTSKVQNSSGKLNERLVSGTWSNFALA